MILMKSGRNRQKKQMSDKFLLQNEIIVSKKPQLVKVHMGYYNWVRSVEGA